MRKPVLLLVALFAVVLLPACPGEPEENWECAAESAPAPGSGVDYAAVYEVVDCSASVRCTATNYCATLGSDISAKEKAIIEGAFADWNVSLKGAVTFSLETTSGCTAFGVVKTNNSDPWLAQNNAYTARAYTDGGAVHMNMDRLCGTRLFSRVIRHEIGHVLGLSHDPTPGTTMYDTQSVSSPDAIATLDVAAYFKTHGCCL